MEDSDFVYKSTIQLLRDQHRLNGNLNKLEERVIVATMKPYKSADCYVNKIDAVKSKLEVCDHSHSIQCSFVGELAKKQLAAFIRDQTEDINILGLLGRQLNLKEACIRIIIKKEIDQLTHQTKCIVKLRLNIYDFEVLKTQWDCEVPACLTLIENDSSIATLLRKKMFDYQKRVFEEKMQDQEKILPSIQSIQQTSSGLPLALKKGEYKSNSKLTIDTILELK